MTFSSRSLLVSISASLLLGVSAAHAGVLVNSLSINADAGSASDFSPFSWGYDTTKLDVPNLQVNATFNDTPANTDGFTFGGQLTSDPHIELFERITNSSASAWSSYTVTVVPDANSTISNLVGLFPGFPDFGATDHFTSSSTTGNVLTFSGGTVNPGETVRLDVAYDISLINNTFPGNFSYTIINSPLGGGISPTPEPASLTLMSAATVLFLKRRRTN